MEKENNWGCRGREGEDILKGVREDLTERVTIAERPNNSEGVCPREYRREELSR